MRRWLADGSITYPENLVTGLDQAAAGFIDMLAGGTVGKTIVQIERDGDDGARGASSR